MGFPPPLPSKLEKRGEEERWVHSGRTKKKQNPAITFFNFQMATLTMTETAAAPLVEADKAAAVPGGPIRRNGKHRHRSSVLDHSQVSFAYALRKFPELVQSTSFPKEGSEDEDTHVLKLSKETKAALNTVMNEAAGKVFNVAQKLMLSTSARRTLTEKHIIAAAQLLVPLEESQETETFIVGATIVHQKKMDARPKKLKKKHPEAADQEEAEAEPQAVAAAAAIQDGNSQLPDA